MKIEKWYDQHTKSYVIQKKDKDGNQIGEAIYCGNKEEAESITEELKRELIKEKNPRIARKLTDEQIDTVIKETAKARYRKKTKQIAVEFNTETESDILDYILSKNNRQGYIKELIRKDMEQVIICKT